MKSGPSHSSHRLSRTIPDTYNNILSNNATTTTVGTLLLRYRGILLVKATVTFLISIEFYVCAANVVASG